MSNVVHKVRCELNIATQSRSAASRAKLGENKWVVSCLWPGCQFRLSLHAFGIGDSWCSSFMKPWPQTSLASLSLRLWKRVWNWMETLWPEVLLLPS